jgi:SAM-dependent methyltransferase
MICPACDGPAVFAFEKDGFALVRCRSCQLLFRRDLPAPDDLLEIYGDAYFMSAAGDTHGQGYDDYLRDGPHHRVNARRRLERLERHIQPGRLLDVGCAAGFFISEAVARGWDAEGIELAESMAAYARSSLGVRVQTADFANADLTATSFDVVTMWDYLEHSIDPRNDLAKAAHLLSPGGMLAISTGDASSILARLSGSRWHLLTPRHHNFFFNRESLLRLLRRSGLDVVSVSYPGSSYSVRYVLYKLRTMLDVEPVRRLAGGVGGTRAASLMLPVNLWDIATVVARKD